MFIVTVTAVNDNTPRKYLQTIVVIVATTDRSGLLQSFVKATIASATVYLVSPSNKH